MQTFLDGGRETESPDSRLDLRYLHAHPCSADLLHSCQLQGNSPPWLEEWGRGEQYCVSRMAHAQTQSLVSLRSELRIPRLEKSSKPTSQVKWRGGGALRVGQSVLFLLPRAIGQTEAPALRGAPQNHPAVGGFRCLEGFSPHSRGARTGMEIPGRDWVLTGLAYDFLGLLPSPTSQPFRGTAWLVPNSNPSALRNKCWGTPGH